VDVAIAALAKHFGETRAVDGLDLEVPTGRLRRPGPERGRQDHRDPHARDAAASRRRTARVFGHDVVHEADVRSRVSLTGQFASVDEDLTGIENLVLLGRLWGYDRRPRRSGPRSCSTRSGSSDAAGRQVKTYSGGMRRRIDIAASDRGHPDLIFLDEPTTGLDPRSRNQVWEIVRALVAAARPCCSRPSTSTRRTSSPTASR
jgi:ABC-2 type transport system ATP-binding protein